jgi:hypothetical protein
MDQNDIGIFMPPDILVGRMEQVRLLVQDMGRENIQNAETDYLKQAVKLLLDSCDLTRYNNDTVWQHNQTPH